MANRQGKAANADPPGQAPTRKSRLRRDKNGQDATVASASLVGGRINNAIISASSNGNGSTTNNKGGSIAWTILVAGLVISLIDLVYIANYLERTMPSGHLSQTESLIIQSEAKKSSASPVKHGSTIASSSLSSSSQDKAPILQLLTDAGIDIKTLDPEILESIPTQAQVTALYGAQPILVGLDTCDRFRSTGDAADHFVGVAGTMNTGTNLLAELLIANCHMSARMAKFGKAQRGVRWQVPWGKHTPVKDEDYRQHHKTDHDSKVDPNAIFPAVTVRDPAAWMASMCRHEYAMDWPHGVGHCPNLVATSADVALDSTLTESTNIPISITYADFVQPHDSLIHHWNEWNNAYKEAPFPRVLVRFEDLIFHPKHVTTAICECAGGELSAGPFQYITGSAKKGDAHGKARTGYIDAIVRYGNDKGRWSNMTALDLKYTAEHVDADLMNLFGYQMPLS